MKKLMIALYTAVAFTACGPSDGTYRFDLYTTNDVHGRYFDSLYVGTRTDNSLMAVSSMIDSIRVADGAENVIFVDAGDCLQGDNASYYYNYVDTVTTHIYARMVDYMGYDAVVVGNHDIETGHPVYDRIDRQMKTPFLAANALRTDNGKPYFQEYVILKRHGVKIAIIGFTNPNIRNWLSPDLWSGMDFESLLPFAQETVDRVVAKEKPHVVIVATHSGTGSGDGKSLESQGLDLYNSLRGVDFVVSAHDHRPVTFSNDSIAFLNSGSHCRNLARGTIEIEIRNGKVVSKELKTSLVKVNKNKVNEKMRETFSADYEAVRQFTIEPVGELQMPLATREAYFGMSDYMNFLHTVSLTCSPARVSFAAPLKFNAYIKPGTLIYNDLFKIYPFENQLFVVKMTGREIKDYLEMSYDSWINQVTGTKGEHLLKIEQAADPRTGSERWSFKNRYYNFDSAGGLVYEVDINKPSGEKVSISSLADGSPFSLDAEYDVAMTSYRASGGGGLMRYGAGIDTDKIDSRVVARYPEIREIIYDFIRTHETITPELVSNPAVIGKWSFIPEKQADRLLKTDRGLLF